MDRSIRGATVVSHLNPLLILCIACACTAHGDGNDDVADDDAVSIDDLPSLRLPGTGYRTLALSDGGELMYAIQLSISGRLDFFRMREEEALAIADKRLKGESCEALERQDYLDDDIEGELAHDLTVFDNEQQGYGSSPTGDRFDSFDVLVGACREGGQTDADASTMDAAVAKTNS